MNIKNVFFCAWSTVALALPLGANAAIIDGTFKAIVASSERGEGLWGDLTGHTITGKFSYDTSQVEKYNFIEPNETRYFNFNNTFVNMTFDIAGHTFDISRVATNAPNSISQDMDMVIVQDSEPTSADDAYDYFMVLDTVFRQDDMFDAIQATGQFWIFDSLTNFTKTMSLEQQFSWVSTGDEPGGYGSFYYSNTLGDNDITAYLNLHMTEVTASIRQSVPEPTSLFLLSTALLGLSWRFRSQMTKQV